MFFDTIIWCAFWIWLARRLYSRFFPAPFVEARGKHVLVTGCDTGFGNMLAKQLDKAGYNVFAGCLTEAGLKELGSQCSDRLIAIRLDITKEDDIAAAVKVVAAQTDRLHAIVNNAGIVLGSWIDWTSLAHYRRVMEVNCFGGIACTKAFLPFLIKRSPDGQKGRVVNITSMAGLISGEGLSAYACSKFAFEAFSDSLRREMHSWGLKVVIIEPGFMKTPIVTGAKQSITKLWEEVPKDVKARWGEDFFQEFVNLTGLIENSAEDPQKTIDALLHAIGSTKPQIRYKPGIQAGWILGPVASLPGEWVDAFMRLLRRQNRMTLKPLILREEEKKQ